MLTQTLRCPHCGHANLVSNGHANLVSNGHARNGRLRFRCKDCNK